MITFIFVGLIVGLSGTAIVSGSIGAGIGAGLLGVAVAILEK